MNCLKCGTPLDLSRPTCASCGTPIDTDGNGLPDVLDELVEKKVAMEVSSALGRVGQDAASPPRANLMNVRDLGDEDDSIHPHHELERCQRQLALNLDQPRPRWRLDTVHFVLLVLLGFGLGGALFTVIVESMVLDRSLVAGTLFCPGQCVACSGPGRIFTWHEQSNTYEGNVSVQLCHNPTVDIDRLSSLDVVKRQDADLEPFRLTLWTSVLCNGILALAVLVLAGPFGFAWLKRRSLRVEGIGLELRISKLKARIEQQGGAGWLPR